IPKWPTLTVGALAVASAIAGGVFGLLALEAQNDYQSFAKLGVPVDKGGSGQTIEGSTLVAKGHVAEQRATISTGLFIGAGGAALVTVVMALFTDWKGYRDQLREREAERQ